MRNAEACKNPEEKYFPTIWTNIFAIEIPAALILSVWEKGYIAITQCKFAVFYFSCLLYLLGLAVYAIRAFCKDRKQFTQAARETIIRIDLMQAGLLLYLTFTVVSAIASPYGWSAWIGEQRWGGAFEICTYVLCALGMSAFARPRKEMLLCCGIVVMLFGTVCVLQLLGFNPLELVPRALKYEAQREAYTDKFLGTIGSVTLGAACLCLLIPPMIIGMIRLKNSRRFCLAVPVVLGIFLLLKMNVLAGLVGFSAGVTAILLSCVWPDKKGRLFLLLLLAAAVIGLTVVLYKKDFSTKTLHELHEILNGRIEDRFGTGRVYIWRNVLERTKSQLWFGSGPDTLRLAMIPGYTELGNVDTGWIADAHSEYLNVLFNQGIFALTAYLFTIASGLIGWIRSGQKSVAVSALGIAVFSYCVQALFGVTAIVNTPCFFVFLGLLDASIRQAKKSQEYTASNRSLQCQTAG